MKIAKKLRKLLLNEAKGKARASEMKRLKKEIQKNENTI